jgi:hypothetical protein
MAEGTCAVPGCARIGPLKRSWCNAHYLDWWKHGGPPPPPARRGRPAKACTVDGCERRHYGKGYCTLHYQRWVKYGDPSVVQVGHWVGEDAGYSAVHARLERYRGLAKTHLCAHCGQSADDWAYDLSCPNEKRGERHGRLLAYSTDPNRYMPLCRQCHAIHDKKVV